MHHSCKNKNKNKIQNTTTTNKEVANCNLKKKRIDKIVEMALMFGAPENLKGWGHT